MRINADSQGKFVQALSTTIVSDVDVHKCERVQVVMQ